MDNIKHRLDFLQEEETTDSPLRECMSAIDYKNVTAIPLSDRYYILSLMQRALNIHLDSYIEYCKRHDVEELRDEAENS
jgi:hypothetical protein